MPVLPDDGSRMRCPGVSDPSFSAASIIARAMRSLTEPNGFWLSILARMRTRGFGLSALTSTSGVLPIMSSTEPITAAINEMLPGRSTFTGRPGAHQMRSMAKGTDVGWAEKRPRITRVGLTCAPSTFAFTVIPGPQRTRKSTPSRAP